MIKIKKNLLIFKPTNLFNRKKKKLEQIDVNNKSRTRQIVDMFVRADHREIIDSQKTKKKK